MALENFEMGSPENSTLDKNTDRIGETVSNAVEVGKNSVSDIANRATRALSMNQSHSEGQVAKTIENQTAKIPSDWFLWAGLSSIAVSAGLQLSGYKKESTFVGQWAPTFLILGLYNKLVKVAGSDREEMDRKDQQFAPSR